MTTGILALLAAIAFQTYFSCGLSKLSNTHATRNFANNTSTAPIPVNHIHSGRILCTERSNWKAPGFDPADCAKALQRLQFDTLRHGHDPLYNFWAVGDRDPEPPRGVVTPRRYLGATCILCLVMLEYLKEDTLPRMPPPPWEARQSLSFGELEQVAGRLLRECVPVGKAGKPGWISTGMNPHTA